MLAGPGVSRKLIEKFQKTFISCEKNILAQNVCVTQPLMEVCTNRAVKQTVQHVYNHKVMSVSSRILQGTSKHTIHVQMSH